jgi:hypothetical protein
MRTVVSMTVSFGNLFVVFLCGSYAALRTVLEDDPGSGASNPALRN